MEDVTKKIEAGDLQGTYIKKIRELDLTISSLDLYIEQLAQELQALKSMTDT